MVDLRVEIDEVIRSWQKDYRISRGNLRDAILDRLTLPEDQGGLGLKIMGAELTEEMRNAFYNAGPKIESHIGGLHSESASIAHKALHDAAPRYPGAEDG